MFFYFYDRAIFFNFAIASHLFKQEKKMKGKSTDLIQMIPYDVLAGSTMAAILVLHHVLLSGHIEKKHLCGMMPFQVHKKKFPLSGSYSCVTSKL